MARIAGTPSLRNTQQDSSPSGNRRESRQPPSRTAIKISGGTTAQVPTLPYRRDVSATRSSCHPATVSSRGTNAQKYNLTVVSVFLRKPVGTTFKVLKTNNNLQVKIARLGNLAFLKRGDIRKTRLCQITKPPNLGFGVKHSVFRC